MSRRVVVDENGLIPEPTESDDEREDDYMYEIILNGVEFEDVRRDF